MPFPIIDLFAGPGGLAEGFSSLTDDAGERVFKIKLSIEKDTHAHQTLTLRSFVRQFPFKRLPVEYYQFLKGEIGLVDLYNSYPEEYKEARNEAWMATLGETPETEIDHRIKNSLNGEKNWVLIGGPPCQAYSLAGRSRVGGISEGDHRVHLYKEYLRIIACHQPAIFVMENVKGLLSAELNGEKIFTKILKDLNDPSSVFPEHVSSKYKIQSFITPDVQKDSDYLIKSENFGIPQRRHRVILLGIREDFDVKNIDTLTELEKVSLKSVIGKLPKLRSGLYREFISSEDQIVNGKLKKKRTYQPIKDSFIKWKELNEKYRKELNDLIVPRKEKLIYPETVGCEFKVDANNSISENHPLFDWYTDQKIGGVLHHVSRAHLTLDLKRYLFSGAYAHKFKSFPRLKDFIIYGGDLVPDHENVDSGKFSDRFRVQMPDEPATTITSHISKDGHYFIHYDPVQCRSLTVREAARIQTFPDNYYFSGSRTQQFHQVGNAVPPYLAYQIAKITASIIENKF